MSDEQPGPLAAQGLRLSLISEDESTVKLLPVTLKLTRFLN